MYLYQLACYERAIRAQNHHQTLDIINCYFNSGLQAAQQCQTPAAREKVYFRLLRTLEETMCDLLMSEHWRIHCFSVIKILTPIIFELVDTKQYEAIMAKLNSLATYFLPTQQFQAATSAASTKKLSG
jgi:hypothetical protein